MRKTVRAAAAAVLASGALLAATPGAALATAPAPWCESGAGRAICDASSQGTTTWTVVFHYSGTSWTNTYTTAGSFLSFQCTYNNASLTVSYSYILNGATETSATDSLLCRTGPWQ